MENFEVVLWSFVCFQIPAKQPPIIQSSHADELRCRSSVTDEPIPPRRRISLGPHVALWS